MDFRKNDMKYPAVYHDLGLIDYTSCLEMQEETRRHIIDNRESAGVLFFLEHPPTYTHGRLADCGNLLTDSDALAKMGVEVHRIDRGGDYTYHGPGQLVAYPIFDLQRLGLNVREYCNALEEVVIHVLEKFGFKAGRQPKYMGVWVDGRKICALGVGVRKWITKHGLAFNINTDMQYFQGIVPCGITEFSVTSLQELNGGEKQDWENIKNLTRDAFIDIFNLELKDVSHRELTEAYLAGER